MRWACIMSITPSVIDVAEPTLPTWERLFFPSPLPPMARAANTSLPALRPRQHVAVGFGNSVRQEAVPECVTAYGE